MTEVISAMAQSPATTLATTSVKFIKLRWQNKAPTQPTRSVVAEMNKFALKPVKVKVWVYMS